MVQINLLIATLSTLINARNLASDSGSRTLKVQNVKNEDSQKSRLAKRSFKVTTADLDETGRPKIDVEQTKSSSRCLCQKQPVPFYKIINYK